VTVTLASTAFILGSCAERDHDFVGHIKDREPETRPLGEGVSVAPAADRDLRRQSANKVMELRMNRKLLLALAGAAAGVFMVYGTAQAAPAASGSLAALKTLGIEQPLVEQAHWRTRSRWRRCHRRWRSGWRC
jgi:hypothetical protein